MSGLAGQVGASVEHAVGSHVTLVGEAQASASSNGSRHRGPGTDGAGGTPFTSKVTPEPPPGSGGTGRLLGALGPSRGWFVAPRMTVGLGWAF
ncbi:MAG TPA: hypothetical protein VEY88_02455 [Archangium sp.]|nr:hypothetical protein [Archangium sp.]